MKIKQIKKYYDFFERTKNEPVIILQGSKRSGKTFSTLQKLGTQFITDNYTKTQCFSASPKQQNFGLMSDFCKIYDSVLGNFKTNATQKTFKYHSNELAFINIPQNINANDIANSLGACDVRYVNECNMFAKETIEKLMINNRGQMIFDFNPYKDFWVQPMITDSNFMKTTWRDNPFLSDNQIALFKEWTEIGQKSEIGSYNYWRWQVMCEGNFAELTGEIFTTENIHFVPSCPVGLHHFMIFADPSNAKGGDSFALTLTAIGSDGNLYLIDSFSKNKIEKVIIAEKIRQWQTDYSVVRTFIETNGEFGLKFYNDCITSKIKVDGWYSRMDKFERIMADFDVITAKCFVVDTPQNREFCQQIYTFNSECEHDDNIDCLNNAIIAYITQYGLLKVLF